MVMKAESLYKPPLFIYSNIILFLNLKYERDIKMFNFNQNNLKNANLFAAGLALGTVGLKVLTSKDAKKVYAGIVAAGLRAKETVLETAEKVQASASDVLAEAQEINEARNEEIFEENK